MLAVALALALVMPQPARSSAEASAALPLDAAIIQDATVVELIGCKTALDRDGRICGKGRRYELKEIERRHALAMINSTAKGARKACSTAPTHAVVFKTTKGARAFDISFSCHTINGRGMAKNVEKDLASLARLFGLVDGLPVPQSHN